MSYYKANQLRVAAKWTRRLGYALFPVIVFVSVAAGQNKPDAQQYLFSGALLTVLVLAITEGAGFLLEKYADRTAKR
jgi:hypothetical protein